MNITTPNQSSIVEDITYRTQGGINVRRVTERQPYADSTAPIISALDTRRGVLLASSFEYPGRYTRWDIGFVDPPLEITSRQRTFRIRALNDRGAVLLAPIARAIAATGGIDATETTDTEINGEVAPPVPGFSEEQRSRQNSVFTLLRAVIGVFEAPEDGNLGFYGAFGYDLTFQFEPIDLNLERDNNQRDLVLYLPDEIMIVDHRRATTTVLRYDFETDGKSTAGMARDGDQREFVATDTVPRDCDHAPGQYADNVRVARDAFARGDLFEVVPGQTFFEPCPAPPSELFERLRTRNPAPYGALMNLGEGEYLVAASPEMFVRVEGRRIETCPISGTIARGRDAIEDAGQILTLLNSEKECSELTMCTDVDRNDKSRVCVPGSVKVIGRRQIEMYSRLIHTVDHVEGTLADGYDALDGFLAHSWAVTVTGAPKRGAMQFIEDHEKSPRLWYGGAIGMVGFDGGMNTGLTLRTVRIKDGVAQIRAGATLLFDSDPEAEEAETRLKASALIDALRRPNDSAPAAVALTRPGTGRKILMVDHEDSFVHTLGGYFRETGAEVITLRAGFPLGKIREEAPDLVLLSPGPGRPADFNLSATIEAALAENIAIFGVCLGLQGIVEYFGGTLGQLPTPVHGKPSRIDILGGGIFDGLTGPFNAGRYHSLHANRDDLPAELRITAETDDGLIMAVEHKELPIAAVQFHPESILSLNENFGRALISNVVARLKPPQ